MNEQHTERRPSEPKRPSAKKILMVISISLLILLPTIFAIVLTIYSEFHEYSTDFKGIEVVLYDEDRNELFRESGDNINNESESLVKILCAIDDNRQEHIFSEEPDKDSTPVIINIIRDGITTELTCYFSLDSEESRCVDSNGETFLIPDMYSEYFIHSVFAEPIYHAAKPPVLSTVEGARIYPQQVNWNYRNASSQWLKSSLMKTVSSSEVYDCTGGIALSFSEAPSNCIIKLYERGEQIYSGGLEGLPTVSLSHNTINVSIAANWDRADTRAYYGTQTYEFSVRIHNKAEFTISSTEISANYPVIVRATNVENLSALVFSSADTSFEPEFHLRGTTAFALIPYPSDAAARELNEFSFTLSYGVSSQTFTLSHDLLGDRVNAQSCELLDIHPDYFNSTIDHVFVGKDHAAPDANKFDEGRRFGDPIVVKNTVIATPLTEYLSRSGRGISVTSCYAGRVEFVGNNASLGNYLIIDLGLDIKLWYCFMGQIYVRIGDTVALGDVIGTTSEIGIRDDGADGFAFTFSYRDQIISPDFVFDLKFTD